MIENNYIFNPCFFDISAKTHGRITALIEPWGWHLYSYVVLPRR